MKGYDFDGVITRGVLPGKDDVIITGRTPDEAPKTYAEMATKGILNIAIYFAPHKYKKRGTREGLVLTGEWKARMLNELELTEFYEDNPVQKATIEKNWNGIVHHVVNGQVLN